MKTEKVIQEIKEQKFISEKQINLLKRRLNDGKIKPSEISEIFDFDISEEQTKKGIEFMKKHNFKSNGDLRKKSVLGYREVECIEHFDKFTFDGFHNAGNGYSSFFVPIYSLCSKENSFQYVYIQGVKIIG